MIVESDVDPSLAAANGMDGIDQHNHHNYFSHVHQSRWVTELKPRSTTDGRPALALKRLRACELLHTAPLTDL